MHTRIFGVKIVKKVFFQLILRITQIYSFRSFEISSGSLNMLFHNTQRVVEIFITIFGHRNFILRFWVLESIVFLLNVLLPFHVWYWRLHILTFSGCDNCFFISIHLGVVYGSANPVIFKVMYNFNLKRYG